MGYDEDIELWTNLLNREEQIYIYCLVDPVLEEANEGVIDEDGEAEEEEEEKDEEAEEPESDLDDTVEEIEEIISEDELIDLDWSMVYHYFEMIDELTLWIT